MVIQNLNTFAANVYWFQAELPLIIFIIDQTDSGLLAFIV